MLFGCSYLNKLRGFDALRWIIVSLFGKILNFTNFWMEWGLWLDFWIWGYKNWKLCGSMCVDGLFDQFYLRFPIIMIRSTLKLKNMNIQCTTGQTVIKYLNINTCPSLKPIDKFLPIPHTIPIKLTERKWEMTKAKLFIAQHFLPQI